MEKLVRPLLSYSISLGNEMSHARGWLPHFKGQIYCNRRNDFIQTPEQLTRQIYPILTFFAEDFPAKASPYQDVAPGSLTPEERSSLRFPDWLKQDGLRILCLRTWPDSCRMTRAGRFVPSSPRFMTWGMVLNGQCLTAPILVPRTQESAFSLSDILIPDASEKYYLSSEQTERLLYKSLEGHKDQESTTPQE